MRQRGKFGEEAKAEAPTKEKLKHQTLQEWVTDICRVKDCYDGFVSREIKGYSVLFACPLCDRHQTNVFPNTAIPTAKRWQGKYEAYTADEMDARLKERQDVVDGIRDRAVRKVNWEETVEKVGAMDDGPF
jgi:hypothetical protein